MNINNNLFYGNLVSEDDKTRLYNWSLDMVAFITGIVKVSGHRLAVARIGTVTSPIDAVPIEILTPNTCGEIYLVDKSEGFMVLRIAKSGNEFIMNSPHVQLLERGRQRNTMVSVNFKRLVSALKAESECLGQTLIDRLISDSRTWQLRDQVLDTLVVAKAHYGGSSYYRGVLTGSEQFDLLDIVLGDATFSSKSLEDQKSWKATYADYCKQKETQIISRQHVAEIYTKPLWVFSVSALGLIVGSVMYPLHEDGVPNVELKTCQVLIPFALYANVHSIPDVALREEIITTLTMARVNRDNSNSKHGGIEYLKTDPDRFFPQTDMNAGYVFPDSQSVAVLSYIGDRQSTNTYHKVRDTTYPFNNVITFVIPR